MPRRPTAATAPERIPHSRTCGDHLLHSHARDRARRSRHPVSTSGLFLRGWPVTCRGGLANQQSAQKVYERSDGHIGVSELQMSDVFRSILEYQLRENWASSLQPAQFDAKNIIANSPSCATISVDEGVNMVQSPQAESRQGDRAGCVPCVIDVADKITHETRNTIR